MKAFRYFSVALCALTGALAQSSSPVLDSETGIPYEGYYNPTYGVSYRAVFPPLSGTAQSTEFIGQIIAPNAAKWIGWALGGSMLNNPLVTVWPNNNTFVVSARWATDYVLPTVKSGPTITTLAASYQNSTHWKWVFRCQGCTTWTGGSGGFDTKGTPVFAWAYSNVAVDTPASPSSSFAQHTDFGFFGFNAVNAHQADYSQWTSTGTGSHTTITTTTTTTSTPPVTPTPVAPFDYIIVGGGAGGLVTADRISETGKRVLLIERGGPSYGSLGGTEIPTWANKTKLTRFDVPGLFESESSGNTWWWCKDISFFAGCLLGGGTAVNGLLFWHPSDVEFSLSNGWPSGWQDVGANTLKVTQRVPGTNNPSKDGKRYLDQVYTVVSTLLKPQGFSELDINTNPSWKDHVYGHSTFDAVGGQRTGPLAAYYPTFKARPNVTVALYTYAQALTRNKGQITGVRTNNTGINGNGTYTLTPKGRVIVSAGAFGTTRLLVSSGIGPTDQIQVVQQNAEYTKYLPPQADWINLPVGYNVQDNPSINFVFEHPDVDSYDNWGKVWDNPRTTDVQLYLNNRSGPLASASPKINFWKAMAASDNKTRYVQGTSRPGACCFTSSLPYNESRIFTITSYLSVGITSRGRIGIDPEMRAKPLVNPWFQDPVDKAVMIKHLNEMISSMSAVPNLRLIFPEDSTSAGITNFVNNYDPSQMNSNHWMGSAKIGTSSSNSVVDPNTKVWNTNNLFVVDASIAPGMPMSNPTAALMVMAEMASAKILALAGGP